MAYRTVIADAARIYVIIVLIFVIVFILIVYVLVDNDVSQSAGNAY